MIEGTLGQALLVLIGLAVLLFAVILVLVEANYILGLIEKLARRWKTTGSGPSGSDLTALDQEDAKRPRDGQGAQ